jgi:signal peptidase I
MSWKFWKKSEPKKPVSAGREWFNSITFAVIAATLIRWTAVEAYVIPTPSMEDTALVGDYLFVSKFHYGTRTTTTPLQIPLTHQTIWGTSIPAYLRWIELEPYRLPGITHVKKGDVVVFNVPTIAQNDGVDHPITLKNNYVKRCLAVGGDTFEVRDRQVYVNGEPFANRKGMKWSYIVVSKEQISDKNLSRLGLDSHDFIYMGSEQSGKSAYLMWLTDAKLEEIKSLEYVISATLDQSRDKTPEGNIFPRSDYSQWNGNNYGPIVVPKQGMTIAVNDSTMGLYSETIRLFEHNTDAVTTNGKLVIDGKELTQYTFKQDHYMMVGDNRNNSLDSRYWGFVPDDHIVGKALFVWMSIDSEAEFFNKVRWRRLFTIIE